MRQIESGDLCRMSRLVFVGGKTELKENDVLLIVKKLDRYDNYCLYTFLHSNGSFMTNTLYDHELEVIS